MTIDIEQCLKNEIHREQTILSLINEADLDSLSKDQIRKRTYQEYDRLNHLLELELTYEN